MLHFSKISAVIAAFIFISFKAFCCTSVIISGGVRADGRPVMLKHRDTGELNNRMEWFQGPEYSFIGLVNSPSRGGEVWSGVNSAGFCIMNTATYDLKDDDVPASEMDKEGIVMYKALGICRCLQDFENMLDSLPKPWGVEANFGIIDAFGGAAYYEVNNHSWKKYIVADQPGGYMVVTNFTRSGRKEDRKGVDRFEKASAIMASADVATIDHRFLFNEISRTGKPIMRDITSASVVFEGVSSGVNPCNTVMWTLLGNPTNTVYVPLKVFASDHIPYYMKKSQGSDNAAICDDALALKAAFGFEYGREEYCCEVEKYVDRHFSNDMPVRRYDRFTRRIYRRYLKICVAESSKMAHKIADYEKND